MRASHGDGTTEAPGDRLHRLAIGRWVLTQKMLHQERRLSAGQHRYLSLLGTPMSATPWSPLLPSVAHVS